MRRVEQQADWWTHVVCLLTAATVAYSWPCPPLLHMAAPCVSGKTCSVWLQEVKPPAVLAGAGASGCLRNTRAAPRRPSAAMSICNMAKHWT